MVGKCMVIASEEYHKILTFIREFRRYKHCFMIQDRRIPEFTLDSGT